MGKNHSSQNKSCHLSVPRARHRKGDRARSKSESRRDDPEPTITGRQRSITVSEGRVGFLNPAEHTTVHIYDQDPNLPLVDKKDRRHVYRKFDGSGIILKRKLKEERKRTMSGCSMSSDISDVSTCPTETSENFTLKLPGLERARARARSESSFDSEIDGLEKIEPIKPARSILRHSPSLSTNNAGVDPDEGHGAVLSNSNPIDIAGVLKDKSLANYLCELVLGRVGVIAAGAFALGLSYASLLT